jgi:hypothetical protein
MGPLLDDRIISLQYDGKSVTSYLHIRCSSVELETRYGSRKISAVPAESSSSNWRFTKRSIVNESRTDFRTRNTTDKHLTRLGVLTMSTTFLFSFFPVYTCKLTTTTIISTETQSFQALSARYISLC